MWKYSNKYVAYVVLLVISTYILIDYETLYASMRTEDSVPPKYDRRFRCRIIELDREAGLYVPNRKPVEMCDYDGSRMVAHIDLNHVGIATRDPYLRCCFVRLVRGHKHWGKFSLEGDCEPITNYTGVNHEFIQIFCSYPGVNLTDFLAVVQPPSKPEYKHSVDDMNVVIMVFDGISRRSFAGHLPLTHGKLTGLDAWDFTKYNRIGKDAFHNFMGLTTGLPEDEFFLCWDKNMEVSEFCPFVWKRFEDKGYVTAFLEDNTFYESFDFEKRGFKKQPFDYYLRPFNSLLRQVMPIKKNGSTCVESKFILNNLLEYTQNYLLRMSQGNYKHFTIIHSSLVRNESTLASLDKNFYEFFQNLEKYGLLENTAFFFLSNHGTKFRKVIAHESPEVNLPFLFLKLPETFGNHFKEAQKNLGFNIDRLTTAFDVHETIKAIMDRDFDRKFGYARGLSLFSDVPKYRSCADAGIPKRYCACSKTILVNMRGTEIHNIATIVLNHMNTEVGLKYRNLCEKLKIRELLKGTKTYMDQNMHDVRVQFSTVPGTGIFEAFIVDVGYQYNVKSIYRLTPFKHESCISDAEHAPYCYCPHAKSEL